MLSFVGSQINRELGTFSAPKQKLGKTFMFERSLDVTSCLIFTRNQANESILLIKRAVTFKIYSKNIANAVYEKKLK